jgi:hypothetical protein
VFAPFAAGAGHSGATFLALDEPKEQRLVIGCFEAVPAGAT